MADVKEMKLEENKIMCTEDYFLEKNKVLFLLIEKVHYNKQSMLDKFLNPVQFSNYISRNYRT